MNKSVFDTQSKATEDNHVPDAEAGRDRAAGSPPDVVGDWLQRGLTDEDEQRRSAPPRYSRRLSDKILLAVHHSCDQGDIEVAWRLLNILDVMARRSPTNLEGGERRRMKDNLVAAHERLWEMRHPEASSYWPQSRRQTLDFASMGGGTIHDPIGRENITNAKALTPGLPTAMPASNPGGSPDDGVYDDATAIGMKSAAASLAPQAHADLTSDFVAKWDPDHDGTLDIAEVNKAADAAFDHDGTLDRKELGIRVTPDEFAAADADHEGTRDKAEYPRSES
jgi:hypothetical protein